ncbi:MAG: oligoendopeptidase F [Proteobacteria bacterium]|nr:MAG: oligoendopeptidase F [Pseudomonadota bacterium]
MNWNLKDLFENEEMLDEETLSLDKKAEEFSKKYKDKLSTLKSDEFLDAIEKYEEILQGMGRILSYSFLKFATDSKEGAFLAKYQEKCNKIDEKLLFFELEFNTLQEQNQDKLIFKCEKYSFYLEGLKKAKSHQLSQKEESLLLKQSMLGASSYSRLFDEHFSTLKFKFDGEELSEEKILSLLHSPDRNTRKKAAKSLSEGLKPHQHLLGYIFNMIKKDLKIKCEIRNYESLEAPRHENNKISQKSVDTLVEEAQKNFGLVHEYYDLKRKLLGFDKLYDYDRYAPLGTKEEIYSFDEAKKATLKAFGEFSPQFRQIAQKAFDERWIDAYPAKDKRSGAFSHPGVPDAHPYVLLNYTDKRRDVFTLAHELGHALHQYLSRDVGYISSDTPLTTAETASVFAEMLVFDSLKNDLSDEEKIPLIAGKLEDIFATLFRQINFTTYERRVHAHEGELSLDDFNSYWMVESEKMFGKSVELGEDYKIWWSYIPHFIHSSFYCYAYSYGQLLVLALYGLYKSKKMDNFVEVYTKFLSLGGSKSPKELVGMFDFDIDDGEFWQIGLNEVKNMLNEFKGLVDGR